MQLRQIRKLGKARNGFFLYGLRNISLSISKTITNKKLVEVSM